MTHSLQSHSCFSRLLRFKTNQPDATNSSKSNWKWNIGCRKPFSDFGGDWRDIISWTRLWPRKTKKLAHTQGWARSSEPLDFGIDISNPSRHQQQQQVLDQVRSWLDFFSYAWRKIFLESKNVFFLRFLKILKYLQCGPKSILWITRTSKWCRFKKCWICFCRNRNHH
jgi:hypothetical protein